ncbi:BspA family leucine-rich repeat surface protein [Nautilia sp.]
MKKFIFSVVLCNFFFVGCGTQTSTNIKGGVFEDSPVSGLDYRTNTMGGVTQDGYFRYDSRDREVLFALGNLKIGTFDLSKMPLNGIVLPADLFGLDRNNTTDERVIKVIEFLQSLDDDENIDNGINITEETKNAISYFVEINDTIEENLTDNNISILKYMVEKINKRWIPEREARENYKKVLLELGYEPDFMPFTTVWKVQGGESITIPVNPNYVYNYTVDWGDGSVSENVYFSISHTYSVGGTYTVKIYKEFPAMYLNNDGVSFFSDPHYTGNADKLVDVIRWGDIEWRSFYHAFTGAENLQITAYDTPILNQVASMENAFAGTDLSVFENVGEWNMTSIINTSGMFACTDFNGSVENWDVGRDLNMSRMFEYASLFNRSLEKWNVSNVTDMSHMFDHASSFNQPLEKWDVSNVTDMSYMFAYASLFNQPLDGWNVSNVKNMAHLFDNARVFDQTLEKWDVSNVTDMGYMFASTEAFNQDISGWNVSNVTDMSHMFENTGLFNQAIGGWDVSKVEDMSYMFSNTSSFNQDIDAWNVGNVKNMSNMFSFSSSFNQDISDWNVSNVTDMSHMFEKALSYNEGMIFWDVSNVRDMSYMFSYSIFNQYINFWNVSNVTNMSHMFYRNLYFNQPLNYWNVSNVTDMSYMFAYANMFNQDISDWNVSNVVNMSHMFNYAGSFDQNISDWNVSKVIDHTDFAVYSPIDGTSKMPKFPF